MSSGTLSIPKLKAELMKLGAKSKELLYHLRQKLKAQGKRGEGFGDWVEKNLDITRRTADRWADAYAISIGEKTTSRQKVQRWVPGPRRIDDNLYPLELEFPDCEERKMFNQAVGILQREKRLKQVIYEAVLTAAKVKKTNARETNPDRSRLAKGSSEATARRAAAHT